MRGTRQRGHTHTLVCVCARIDRPIGRCTRTPHTTHPRTHPQTAASTHPSTTHTNTRLPHLLGQIHRATAAAAAAAAAAVCRLRLPLRCLTCACVCVCGRGGGRVGDDNTPNAQYGMNGVWPQPSTQGISIDPSRPTPAQPTQGQFAFFAACLPACGAVGVCETPRECSDLLDEGN